MTFSECESHIYGFLVLIVERMSSRMILFEGPIAYLRKDKDFFCKGRFIQFIELEYLQCIMNTG